MRLQVKPFKLHKRFPLTIARGTSAENTNLWVILDFEGIQGWGEASPLKISRDLQNKQSHSAESLTTILEDLAPTLANYTPWQRQEIEKLLLEQEVPSPVRAAIDIALHDWMGKFLQQPVWQLWGLNRSQIKPISVTIGISTPTAAQTRLKNWLTVVNTNLVKVKLGSPEGIEADKAMFLALEEIASTGTRFLVDVNGGWSLKDAIAMSQWLAERRTCPERLPCTSTSLSDRSSKGSRRVEYIEQPLAQGQEADLLKLKPRCPLPIFVDESCWVKEDIPQLAKAVDGINIKLLKAGGLTEAWRMVQVAKACGLQVMLGCYSDSDLLNTAAAQLSPLADYLDLDSHLNLLGSPFQGARIEEGKLLPNNLPGLGVSLC